MYRGRVRLGEVGGAGANMAILANAADRDGVRIDAAEEARELLIMAARSASRSRSTAPSS